nr:unnamed protein product [Spirometra erinaceieuropaei]
MMVFARANTISQKLVPKLTQSRFNSTLDSLKALVKSSRIKIGEWKSLKIPPNSGPKILSNNYVPFSKRFLFREIVSDPKLVHSSKKEAFENIALYLDEKASIEYSTLSEELSTLACDFNSGSFALAHLLGLSQAELLKSSLLVYSLLLQATSDGAPLNRSQLEIRIESWVAQRLSPRTHQSLPATSSATASGLGLSRFAKNFTGGSGPLFDLTFDAQPALAFLRKLDLVRGSDERLEAVLPNVLTRSSGQTVARAWSFLSPQCDEDDLGFPRVAIKQ